MSIAAIKEWLANPLHTYGVGVELFSQHSNKEFLKRMFLKSEDDYNFSRLISELQLLVDGAGTREPIQKLPKTVRVESDAAPAKEDPVIPEEYARYSEASVKKIDVSELPEDLQKLVAEKGILYRQATHLQSRLMLMPDNKERQKAADDIVNKFRRIQEIWMELDYFQAYKIPMPKGKKDISKMSPTQLIKERNNLRTKVSRYRSEPDSERYKTFVAELEAVNLLITKYEEDEPDEE